MFSCIVSSLALHSQQSIQNNKQYTGLSGPSYSLTQARGTLKYNLPPSRVLQVLHLPLMY